MRLAYPFTYEQQERIEDRVAVLGGKGAGLAAMTTAGLPVPPGFTLATGACRNYLADGWTDELDRAVDRGIEELERQTGKRLGSVDAPLLVSVRSGAETSMPGMMDTILNLGINDRVEAALAGQTGDPDFAADTHRRALLSFAHIVLGAPKDVLAGADQASTPSEVAAVLGRAGYAINGDPIANLKAAIRAVFDSWMAPRAISYREIEGIDEAIGTAATVQTMVFGNMGDTSGTGVAFTRNPSTGRPGLMGDFLPNAQGEDVVAGDHVTLPLADMETRWPEVYHRLHEIADMLEVKYADMVDIEFTVERGRLWMLQARPGKRSPIAAFRMAIDMANDETFPVDRAEAVARCRRYFDDPPLVLAGGPDRDLPLIATGLGASPGRASGVLCLDPDRAVDLRDQGRSVILARRETSPSDVHGVAASVGLFTTLGGQVSHAALVAREWGLPAVVGASEATIGDGVLIGPGGRVEAGTVVTIDGDGGRLLLGDAPVDGRPAPEVLTIKSWAAELDEADHGAPGTSVDPPDTGETAEAAAVTDDLVTDDLAFRVLHAFRIKGMVTAEVLVGMCRCGEQAVTEILDAAVGRGHATFMEPRGMWVMTQDGRAAHEPVLAQAVAALEMSGLPYQPFLDLNTDFKQLCNDWQLRDGEPNDHSDADYDAAIRARLADHDDRSQPVIGSIAAMIPWMSNYGSRLEAAGRRVLSGDPKALTGVMCDSYHDIWMELHEDLILTQGIDRAAEGST